MALFDSNSGVTYGQDSMQVSGEINPAMSEVRENVRHSIVVPLYNERENIVQLYEQLKETMELLGDSFELVFVDDGSTDDSAGLLRDIALQDGRVTVITLPRNSGKSAALGAGFEVALGDNIVTMDGDLQHHSSDIPRFVEKLREGFDIVCGQRLQRSEDSWMQRMSNRAANWMTAKLSGVRIHDFGSGFKAYKREFVAQLPVYGEMQRLIPILALRQGCRICEIPITIAPERAWGIEIWILAEGSFFLRSHHGALPCGIFVTADAFFWHGGHRCGICGERHRFLAAD